MWARGCITPKVIENVNKLIEGDLELFDGYEDLPEEWQEKVQRALKQGHVDDEDWRGVSIHHSLLPTSISRPNACGRG
jgi:hypothetical protein